MSSTTSQLNKNELKDELIRAGAGAGKTTALVQRVIEIVAHHRKLNGQWPRLVVTTFTRKATQELRERLTLKACELQDLELLDYCRSRSRLHISTIHGVLGLFLRRYGHLLGLDPSYTILTEIGAADLRKRVLREVLMSSPQAAELLETYSLSKLESMLVAFVEAKVIHAQLRSMNESEILSLQHELAIQLAQDLKQVAKEIQESTSHEGWIEYAHALHLVSQTLVLEWASLTWDRLQAMWSEFPNKPRKSAKTALPAPLEDRIAVVRERLKKWMEDPCSNPAQAVKWVEQAQKFEPLANQFLTALISRKRELGQMEMSDLELLALQFVREQPAVGEAFASDWDHWLIDEYQDTSPLQVELLEHLSRSRPRYVVGDPQQSIYLFRGARSEVFQEEEKKLRDRGLEPQFKLKNYRSHPSLLQFINDFFRRLNSEFQMMEPRQFDFDSTRVVARFLPAPEQETGVKRGYEYAGMVQHIDQLIQKDVPLSDICILARKNKTLLEIAQYLKELGYPTHVHASRGYSRRREVRDAIALLQFLAQPADDENLVALLRSPWCRVQDDELVRARTREEMSFWNQIQNGPLAQHPAILRLKEALSEVTQVGFSLAWEKALIRFCFIDLSHHHDATGRREANLWKLMANLALEERQPGFRILDFIAQASSTQADTESADEGDAVTAVEPNVINLMTVHAAKGLQRRHVLIPHCDETTRPTKRNDFAWDRVLGQWSIPSPGQEDQGLLHSPLSSRISQDTAARELSEQDRLLYVAITRAEESVFLSWTGSATSLAWAGRWRWDTSSAGFFKTEFYQYEVISPSLVAPPLKKKNDLAIQVRRPWSAGIQNLDELPPTLSVSELLEHEVVKGRRQFAAPRVEGLTERIEKAVLGIHLHRLFELMAIHPGQDLTRLAEIWFPQQRDRVMQALQFVRQLDTPPIAVLLKTGRAEWGFQVRLGASILEGQIDLWGQTENEIWVVDYKSGDPNSLEKAFAQLEIYAMALTRFGHQKPIRMSVVYPFAEQVHIREFKGVGM